jgi:hypothetical protein
VSLGAHHEICVSLRLVLDNQLAGLAVAQGAGHQVVAPFPVAFQDGKFRLRAAKGSRYQVLVDGERVIDIESQGEDNLALPGRGSP